MLIYISGAISNRKFEDAKQHFDSAEEVLIKRKHTVVNPVNLSHDHDKSWLSLMKEDLTALLSCDGIYMLRGWEQSKGACIEFNLAKDLELKILFE